MRGEWHHRRSRSVHDNHTHCPCNGVYLCGSCHRWVHAHPMDARRDGLIVARHIAFPASVPILAQFGGLGPGPGECLLTCVGTLSWDNLRTNLYTVDDQEREND